LPLARVDGRITLLADNGEGKKPHSSNGVAARLGNTPVVDRSDYAIVGNSRRRPPCNGGWVSDPSGVSVPSPLDATALGML